MYYFNLSIIYCMRSMPFHGFRVIQQPRQDYPRDCKGTKTVVKRHQPYSKKA